ncbi:MAG: 3-isopropylmalate dehydratase [Candidatus Lokiarchaeota archaeon]|jgi:3-isopropylmalate/(R)-2-methylmalate dehydratase small subunit
MEIIKGFTYVLGDDINTDDIVPSYTLTMRDSNEMAKHTLEFIDPDFVQKTERLNIIVAGNNFGTGSSREEAVHVFKVLGIKAIIAKSFARIYFRNLINNGIPAIEVDWKKMTFLNDDLMKIDLNNGMIENLTQNFTIEIPKLPSFLREILKEGGIINKLKKELIT